MASRERHRVGYTSRPAAQERSEIAERASAATNTCTGVIKP